MIGQRTDSEGIRPSDAFFLSGKPLDAFNCPGFYLLDCFIGRSGELKLEKIITFKILNINYI
jgi:hypothetical protein